MRSKTVMRNCIDYYCQNRLFCGLHKKQKNCVSCHFRPNRLSSNENSVTEILSLFKALEKPTQYKRHSYAVKRAYYRCHKCIECLLVINFPDLEQQHIPLIILKSFSTSLLLPHWLYLAFLFYVPQ